MPASQPSLHKPRILVILQPHMEAARLLRVAKRKAEFENIDWEVLVIETRFSHRWLSKEMKENLLSTVTLAEQMGATVTKVYASTIVEGVKEIVSKRAEENIPIYSIKIAEIRNEFHWFEWLYPLQQKLQTEFAGTLRISSIPLGFDGDKPILGTSFFRIKLDEILFSLLSVVIAMIVIQLLGMVIPEAIGPHNRNKTIIFIIACAFSSGRYGLLAGLITSVASFFALSTFYIAPYFSLKIDDTSEAVSLVLFLIATLIISFVESHDYTHRNLLFKKANRFNSLLRIHRVALNKNNSHETIKTLDEELKHLLGTNVAFFLPSLMDEKQLETVFIQNLSLNESEKTALKICWEESKTTGVGAPYEPENCNWRFEPMVTAHDEIGVFGIQINKKVELDEDFGQLTASLADQVALILERMQIGKMAEETRIQAEREKLRSMLLSSVSHDLKTPLASIIGSLSVFRSMRKNLSEEHQETLLNTAIDEAQRLDSFITNILDMTRIESGQIELKKEWVNPEFLLKEISKRLRERLRNHHLTIFPNEQKIEVSMDSMLTGQVIQNLLDNAAKYTKDGTKIDVSWKINEDKSFILYIRDHGNGIPEDRIEKIFDKYTRINKQDHQVAGTGLGLAIARAIITHQDGSLRADNHPEGGAVFIITLPETRLITEGETV